MSGLWGWIMVTFLLVSNCPKHHHVEIEETALPGALGVSDPGAVSLEEAEMLAPDRELIRSAEHGSYVNRKCPKCNRILAFDLVKAWEMTSPHIKGQVVWEAKKGEK